MDALPSITVARVLSGFGVGVLVGMTGVGGGSLMTPLLVLLFGMHPATAVGTDLFFAAATKASARSSTAWVGPSAGTLSDGSPAAACRPPA